MPTTPPVQTATPATAASPPCPVTAGAAPARAMWTWVFSSAVLAAIVLWSFYPTLVMLAGRWWNDADYSHGFFVPVFSLVLLWVRRGIVSDASMRGSWWGAVLLASAAAVRWASAYYGHELLDAFSLIPTLAGIVLLVAGWRGFRWAWPSIMFLVFMIPLPGVVAGRLNHPLQRVATEGSVYALQTVGVPAVAQGNVIWLSAGQVGVAEACSGLRMLHLFFAFCVAATFLVKRPLWEKAIVVVSAIGIGIVANIIRIVATGVVHETISPEAADKVFHDFAGLMLPPVATLLLLIELYLLSVLVQRTPENMLSMSVARSKVQHAVRRRAK